MPTKPEALPCSTAMPAVKELSNEERRAVDLLNQLGVLPSKAESLVGQFGVESVVETVEYLAATALAGKRRSVENRAGLIIYSLENALPVPASFMSSRRQQAVSEVQQRRASQTSQRDAEFFVYKEWLEVEQDRVVRSQFSQSELDLKLAKTVRRNSTHI